MSIKDLFDKGHSLKFVKNKTQDDLAESVESSRYIDVYSSKRDRFIPDVDFMTASNFARFGLAEEYYDAAIKRIYQTYPYDGSQTEKIEQMGLLLSMIVLIHILLQKIADITAAACHNIFLLTEGLMQTHLVIIKVIFLQGHL